MKTALRTLMALIVLASALAVNATGVAGAVEPAVTSPEDLAILNAVSIQPSDLRSGFEILPCPSGTSVDGFISLDVCGADLPSEALRTGRSQVSVVPSDDPTIDATIFSVEAVMYQDEQAAAQAMTEVAAAAKNCPTSFVEGHACTCHVGDHEPQKWRFHPAPDHRWKKTPGTQRIVFDGRLIVPIYGAPFDIAYAVPGGTKAEQRLVNAIAQRLAATPL